MRRSRSTTKQVPIIGERSAATGYTIMHSQPNVTAERSPRWARGKTVLDYGCGDGALLSWISREVRPNGAAHGFDPNLRALQLAGHMMTKNHLSASLHADVTGLSDEYFDAIICAEVIEHVHDVNGLIVSIYRLLKAGGRAVITTPVRITETPLDPNHIREWFPTEFAALFAHGPLHLVRHEQFIPAAAPEVYFWRPPLFFRIPVFRVLCNLLSIYRGLNALSWLRLRPLLFMTQLAVLEKPL